MSVSVSLNKTLSNPYYLFSFTHIQSKNQVNFIPKVLLINDRYDEFVFEENNTQDLTQDPPKVFFRYDGQYWVEIYEQTSSGNTDPSQAYNMLWDGRGLVENPQTQSPYYQWESSNEDNANFIFISDDENPPSPTPSPTSTLTPTPTPTESPVPSPTPTGTSTPTPTPTQTGTPTPTPTSTTAPRYPFLVMYDGSLSNLCSGSGTISMTLWGLNPVYENNTNLYLDNALTIPAPLGYAEYSGTILEINPSGVVSGVVVCPSPTPTQTGTPTPTPTPTESPIPSPSPTGTATPTPTTTPTGTPIPSESPTPTPTGTPTPTPTSQNNFIIGAGAQGTPIQLVVDQNNNVFLSSPSTYQGYLIGSPVNKGMVKINDSGAIDLTFQSGTRSGIDGGKFVLVDSPNENAIYTAQQSSKRLVKIDKTTGNEIWFLTANNNIRGLAIDPVTNNVLVVGDFTSIGGQSQIRIALVNSAGVVQVKTPFNTGFNQNPIGVTYSRNGNWHVVGPATTYAGLPISRIVELDGTTFTDTGFWGGSNTIVGNNIFQRKDNGYYYITSAGGTLKGSVVDKIAVFTEAGVNVPYTPTIASTPWGHYLDEVNNLIYVSNSASPCLISRYNTTTAVRDTAWETNMGTIAYLTITPSTTWSQLIGVNTNNKIYLTGGIYSVQGVATNGIVRVLQNGVINTAIY